MAIKIEITEIPPMPQSMMQVIQFDPLSDTASSSHLERIILPDKGMTASIMRIANSAYYGQSGKVKTLQDAITLLGLKATKNLVILLNGQEIFGRLQADTFRLLVHESSILAALIAIDISKPLGQVAVRDEAFIFSLLHNIGMSVIALNARSEYERVLNSYLHSGGSLPLLEQQQLGTDHMAVGLEVFKKWKLPEGAHDIVFEYDFDPTMADQKSALHRVVSLAVLLARRILALPDDEEAGAREEAVLKSFGKDRAVTGAFDGAWYNMIQDHPFYQLAMEL
ncbi:MAG: HDOD domain-containing protein [Leptospiraceae bacterium]|nr:HDOD domain-containing protein [Leptospiraceae bacterium]